MLRIKKLTPELLKEGITFNDYKKMVRPLLNGAKQKHQGADQTVDFFILTNFEFSDKPGKKTTIFVPGKHDNSWKKYLKELFKEDKRNLMLGKCYISGEGGSLNLNLIPEKGNAKMNIITKQGKKMFAMAKLSVQLADGAEEATNASGGRTNQPSDEELKKAEEEKKKQEEARQKEEEQKQQESTESSSESDSSQDRESLKKMLQEQLKGLAAKVPLVKESFNAVKEVVSKYKDQKVAQEDEKKLSGVLGTLKEFMNSFDGTHKEVQKRMKDAHKKVKAQMPKLEALHKRLKEQVEKTKKEEQESSTSTDSSSNLDPEVIKELREQMDTAKAAIDKLKKELDLDALLAQV